jgi:hypothetical protein
MWHNPGGADVERADTRPEAALAQGIMPGFQVERDYERRKMKTWILPTVLIVIDLLAATVYACNVDWRRAVYWVAAAVLTATVTF